MLYTELTKKAMLFAYRAHEHQLDKGGMPYIMHPLAVAEMMGDDESAVVIAMLVMFIVFSIPHSMRGSELNHETGKIESGK